MILVPPTPFAIRHVADNLREHDKRELDASQPGKPHRQIVDEALEGSVMRFAISPFPKPGDYVGLWGVQPLASHPEVGSIWMVGTAGLESISLSFLRACRPAITQAHERFRVLACAAHRDNTLHLNWLRWLGFTANDVGHPHFIPHTHV
jgi:hypothetical protein